GITGEFGISPQDLHLEIDESCYAENPQQLVQVTGRLRDKGFVVELDDFGSGHSSLSILSSLPIDVLKIDMQFIKSMHDDEKNMKMLEIIMDIARTLDVPVTAEGVQTEQQYRDLKKMNCNMIQGYFSKPVPADEFEALLTNS
nr:EAL domain-containing protein [Eubacterium sp.]